VPRSLGDPTPESRASELAVSRWMPAKGNTQQLDAPSDPAIRRSPRPPLETADQTRFIHESHGGFQRGHSPQVTVCLPATPLPVPGAAYRVELNRSLHLGPESLPDKCPPGSDLDCVRKRTGNTPTPTRAAWNTIRHGWRGAVGRLTGESRLRCRFQRPCVNPAELCLSSPRMPGPSRPTLPTAGEPFVEQLRCLGACCTHRRG
jgi:hypothetical protein